MTPKIRTFVLLLVALLLPGAAGKPQGPPAIRLAAEEGPPTAPPEALALQRRIWEARDRVLPALVHIEPVLELYRGGRKSKVAVKGSGVIVHEQGYVITNNHVVEKAKRVACTLFDRQEVSAEVIGRDPLTDVAVIRLNTAEVKGKLPVAVLGSSKDLQEGQQVMALGSPLGFARSISFGVVSSRERYLPESEMRPGEKTGAFNIWIQTDAAINPGNSGGPLVDLDGRVVGINARAITLLGENLGFAIPIDIVRAVAEELIANGKVERSWVGVQWQNTQQLGTFFGIEGKGGVLVGSVVPGSPAERAGLRAGDVVVEWNGKPVSVRYEEELPAFLKALADLPVGTRFEMKGVRAGQPFTVRTKTEVWPDEEAEELACETWGPTARAITPDAARGLMLAVREGALVSGIRRDSPAQEAGMQAGDVIVEVDEEAVKALPDLEAAYERAAERKAERVLLVVQRGTAKRFLLVKPAAPGRER